MPAAESAVQKRGKMRRMSKIVMCTQEAASLNSSRNNYQLFGWCLISVMIWNSENTEKLFLHFDLNRFSVTANSSLGPTPKSQSKIHPTAITALTHTFEAHVMRHCSGSAPPLLQMQQPMRGMQSGGPMLTVGNVAAWVEERRMRGSVAGGGGRSSLEKNGHLSAPWS